MAGLGPWPADRRVAVAVSGGADSLCLAWLAARWGRPLGLIVDHGLRMESAAEAAMARDRLAGFGVVSQVLTLRVPHGPGLAARARAARYGALAQAVAELGLSDLLVGHHAGDQAETVLMRAARSSGPLGLSGMSAIVEGPRLRLVRPLLATPPDLLRALLRAHRIAWTEDPSNADPGATRTGLRARLADAALRGEVDARIARHGAARAIAGQEVARILARRAAIFPEGYALLDPGPIEPDALAALVRALTGSAYPAPTAALARMAADPRPGTLGGLRLTSAGRLGPGLLLVREAGAMRPPVPAIHGTLWDRRFHLDAPDGLPHGAELGPLGRDARLVRGRTSLPASVLATLPALRASLPGGGRALAVPHLAYFDGWTNRSVRLTFSPSSPAAGAPFCVLASGDAERPVPPHVLDEDTARWSG